MICNLNHYFFYLVARARVDTEKIDHDVKQKAERLHHVATVRDISELFLNKEITC